MTVGNTRRTRLLALMGAAATVAIIGAPTPPPTPARRVSHPAVRHARQTRRVASDLTTACRAQAVCRISMRRSGRNSSTYSGGSIGGR